MAVIQLWFIQLLTGPWNPIWQPYLISVAIVALVSVVIFLVLSHLSDYYLWDIDGGGLTVIYILIVFSYAAGAALVLFPNWGS